MVLIVRKHFPRRVWQTAVRVFLAQEARPILEPTETTYSGVPNNPDELLRVLILKRRAGQKMKTLIPLFLMLCGSSAFAQADPTFNGMAKLLTAP